MNKAVLLAVLVTLAFVATAFLVLHYRQEPSNVYSFGTQWLSMGGIPKADMKDYAAWKRTPEHKTVRHEMVKLFETVPARGGPNADEAEVLIEYMHSPYYGVRRIGVLFAGYARSEPVRSVLLPHVVGLLSDRTSWVRLFAADSLGKMGDKSVIPSLEPLLKDPIPLVAKAAQEAISKLESQKETVSEH